MSRDKDTTDESGADAPGTSLKITGRDPSKGLLVRLPESFDPLAAVENKSNAAYASWIVGAIVRRQHFERDATPETFVPMDSRYIAGHIPEKAGREVMRDLRAAGEVECDDYYFYRLDRSGPGKCLYYRLGEPHRSSPLRRHHLTHREVIQKDAVWRDRERAAITDPTHVRLREWHDRVELLPTAPRDEHLLLDNLHDGNRWFIVCPQGRVHTNITNLPRQYRCHVRVGGCELVSCDVATSQPLVLGVIIKQLGDTSRGPDQGRKKKRKGRGRGGPENPQAFVRHDLDRDLSNFLADCLRGVVYDRIAAATGYTRDEVKPMFLATIYGHPDDMGTKVGLAIRSLYPAVYNAVRSLTQVHGVGWLPREMQRAESAVMIGRVAGRLVREFPAVPLLTVHDSVLVPGAYAEPAAAVIREEWAAVFGVEPRVKFSDFTAPQEPRQSRRGRPRPQLGESACSA